MRTKLSLGSLALGALLLAACSMASPPPPGDFNIVEQGAVYVVNGVTKDPLVLTRGVTYTFSVNAPGHPLYITTSDTGGGRQAVSTGVSGAPEDVGTVTFTPDAMQAEPIYYQCAIHTNMGGLIDLVP